MFAGVTPVRASAGGSEVFAATGQQVEVKLLEGIFDVSGNFVQQQSGNQTGFGGNQGNGG